MIIDVEESPVVRQITISGNESIDGEKIRDILTLTTGATLDYPLLFENRERIAALYRAEGYYLAEVGYGIEPLSEASVSINFEVDEGGKLKLREIDFVGNEHFSDRELRDGFQTGIWHFWSLATSWFDRSGTYSEPLFIQDLRGVEKRYTDAGYLRVEVGEPNVVAEKSGLTVTVSIEEGQRFRVGKLDIQGDDTVDLAALHEQARAARGRHLQPQLPHGGRREAHGILRRPRLLLRERDAALEPVRVDRRSWTSPSRCARDRSTSCATSTSRATR